MTISISLSESQQANLIWLNKKIYEAEELQKNPGVTEQYQQVLHEEEKRLKQLRVDLEHYYNLKNAHQKILS